jgi:hypothetical protein
MLYISGNTQQGEGGMRLIPFAALTAGVVMLASCASEANRVAHPGEDAGYLVLGLGAYDSTSSRSVSYEIAIRKVGGNDVESIRFIPRKVADLPFMGTKTDYDSAGEAGVVEIRKMPAGQYEIFRIDAGLYTGIVQWHWSSKEDVHIPFTISSGAATYLGHFQGHVISERHVLTLGAPFPSSVYFVVSNRGDRDIPIAQKKASYLTLINTEVPPVADLKSNYFLANCPNTECD